MLKFILFVFLLFIQFSAQAERLDFKIFDVRKNLPLKDEDPVFYDYYMSVGQDVGVEPGSILTVYRRIPVMDTYKNQNHPDMQIAVARIKVIYSQKTISVGRVLKTANRETTPVMDIEKVMVGDRVELTKISEEKDAAGVQNPQRQVASPTEPQMKTLSLQQD